MTLRTSSMGLLLASLAGAACAQSPKDVTDGELALLPPFCYDTMGMRYGSKDSNRSPRASHWEGLMGQSFWAMHHYCWAKINQRRIFAPGTDPKYRIGLLGGVVGDLGFVINNSPPDFIMLPEIYSALGEVELLRKNPAAANGHFNTARKLKPSYPPPYQLWSEYLLSIGKKDEAKALLKLGLEHNSTAVSLQALYNKLGGDPKMIAPVVTNVPNAPIEPPATPAAAASRAAADPAAAPASAPALPAEAGSSPQSGAR